MCSAVAVLHCNVTCSAFAVGMQRFVWEIMKKSRVWNDFLKNMCSKDFTQNLDLFGETLFFYPVANTFSQTGCQIPVPVYEPPDIQICKLGHCTFCSAFAGHFL